MQVSNINNQIINQNYRASQNRFAQNSSNLNNRNLNQPAFKGGASLVTTATSKSQFFAPFEKTWNSMTDWLAKNLIAKAMNTDLVGKFAEKTKDSKYITNHIITAGAAVGTSMYMYKTMHLPEEKMDKDRRKVLTLNHALTFAISTAGSYLADGALFGKWREVTNKYAVLYTKDNDLLKKLDTMNKELKAAGKNKMDIIDYASDVLDDQKLVKRLKGMDIAKTLLICTCIYRYLVPVLVTPLANKLGDKFLAHKKEQEQRLQKA